MILIKRSWKEREHQRFQIRVLFAHDLDLQHRILVQGRPEDVARVSNGRNCGDDGRKLRQLTPTGGKNTAMKILKMSPHCLHPVSER